MPKYSTLPSLALLPLADGDVALVFYIAAQDAWVAIRPTLAGIIPPEYMEKLIHLSPVASATDEELIAQFRNQLDEMGSGDDVDNSTDNA